MRKIRKIILTLGCGVLLLVWVVGASSLIGSGPDRNNFLLVVYFGLGTLSVIATGIYLRKTNADLGGAGLTLTFILAISGGALLLAWPLLLPILIWNEAVFTRILKKNYFPTRDPREEAASPVDRTLSDEEKLEAMRELLRRSK